MAAVDPNELIELDSNFLIAAYSKTSVAGRELEQWLRQGNVVQMSAIAWSEYLCGPLRETELHIAGTALSRIEAFTGEDAELSSQLFNHTGRRTRSHVDCMIAAHAIRRNALLATLNLQDFGRFEKFQLRLARDI